MPRCFGISRQNRSPEYQNWAIFTHKLLFCLCFLFKWMALPFTNLRQKSNVTPDSFRLHSALPHIRSPSPLPSPSTCLLDSSTSLLFLLLLSFLICLSRLSPSSFLPSHSPFFFIFFYYYFYCYCQVFYIQKSIN